MKREERPFGILFISESSEESRLFDHAFGSKVEEDGLIGRRIAECRLSDGYGEHYVLIKREPMADPVPMLLFCPRCGVQHVDKEKGAWTNPPHATHTCAGCGLLWRPSNVNTAGVASLEIKEPHHQERITACFLAESTGLDARRFQWIEHNALAYFNRVGRVEHRFNVSIEPHSMGEAIDAAIKENGNGT